MAFRRQVLIGIGGFDEALDMGTVIPGGGDLDMFGRLLRAGYVARYSPHAEMWHHHRRTMRAVTAQFWGYGASQGALVAKLWWSEPDQRREATAFLRRRIRRLLDVTVRSLRAGDDPPWWLRSVELVGIVAGIPLYPLSVARSRRLGRPAPGVSGSGQISRKP